MIAFSWSENDFCQNKNFISFFVCFVPFFWRSEKSQCFEAKNCRHHFCVSPFSVRSFLFNHEFVQSWGITVEDKRKILLRRHFARHFSLEENARWLEHELFLERWPMHNAKKLAALEFYLSFCSRFGATQTSIGIVALIGRVLALRAANNSLFSSYLSGNLK